MAEAYNKGHAFELEVAKMIRRKGGDKSAKKNRGSHANWHRRSDIFTELPIHVEAKHHDNIRIKEWFAQAEAAASYSKIPVVVYRDDPEIMAALRFNDLLDLFVQVADLQAEVEDLRQPIEHVSAPQPAHDAIVRKNVSATKTREEAAEMAEKATKQKLQTNSYKTCRAGHISDDYGKCMIKGCKYGRVPGKAKKGEK